MAKFSGNVGYIIEEETAPGVFTQEPIERKMFRRYSSDHLVPLGN